MSVLQAGLLNQSSAQVIDGSLKFDDARNNRLSAQYLMATVELLLLLAGLSVV